jgi:MraZ protein
LIGSATEGPFTTKGVRETTRFLIGGASEIETDEQGRFVLPKNLKNYAQIKNEVVFIGLLRWIEVWDITLWNEYGSKLEKVSVKVGQKLKKT